MDRILAGEPVARRSAANGRQAILLSHPSRKRRGVDGAQSIQGEPSVKELGRATCRTTTKEAVSVSKAADGTVTITRTRPGFDGSQTFTKTIDSAGNTSSLQTAHDAAGNLVHYDPKN